MLPELLLFHKRTPLKPRVAGAYLYGLLADNGLRPWLEEVRRSQAGQRRVLLQVDEPHLRRLPWEMLLAQPGDWAPFLNRETPWTRVSGPFDGLASVAPPVRVLFVAGAYDDVKLHADDELDAIMRALCTKPAEFHVEYLVAPTKAQFKAAYDEVLPHVLHVVAHGDEALGETVLSLRAGEVGSWSLTPMHVANGLASCPRLVVLNACRSGLSGVGSEAGWNFADHFLDRGAGAVVTMLGDIPADEAVAFTEAFYSRLAEEDPLDVAVGEGRRAIFDVSESPDVWSIPSLVLGAAPDLVLGVPPRRPASPRLDAVVRDAVRCVDRATERRRVWTKATPETASDSPRLIVVSGGEKTGKSAVVKGALPACHARGCDIAYIDFGPSSRLGWYAAVKRVHDHLRDWLPEHDERLRHFAHVAETSRTGPYLKRDVDVWREFGDNVRFENEADMGDHRKDLIFRELCQLVESCAGDNKLLLVLDHLFSGLSDEALDDYLVPRLVQPIVDDPQSNVVLVVVVPKNHNLPVRRCDTRTTRVEVQDFEKPAFELLLREYVARIQPAGKLPPERKAAVRTLASLTQTWTVKDLTVWGKAATRV